MQRLLRALPLSIIATLLSGYAVTAQQIAAIANEPDKPAEVKPYGPSRGEGAEAQISSLRKRLSALKQYLSTVDASSPDFQATRKAVAALNLKLDVLGVPALGDDQPQKVGGAGTLKDFCPNTVAVKVEAGRVILLNVGGDQNGGGKPFTLLGADIPDYNVARALVNATLVTQCPDQDAPEHPEGARPTGEYEPKHPKKTSEAAAITADDLDDPNFYCIIHMVHWTTEGEKPTVAENKWYLFRGGQGKKGFKYLSQTAGAWNIEGDRIYGSKRVALLYVHIHARKEWNVEYDVTVKGKQSEALVNLGSLLGAIQGLDATQPPLWSGKLLDIPHQPSDITVQGIFKTETATRRGQADDHNQGGGDGNSDSRQRASGHTPTGARKKDDEGGGGAAEQKPVTYEKKYDDEGLSYWNVSAGVPLKNVKTLQFGVADNTLTATKVDKQKYYGFLDIYLPPADIKGGHWQTFPHLLVGVPLSGKPLNNPAAALGWGYSRFQGYLGYSFNKVDEPATLQVGDPATQAQLNANLRSRYKANLIFGIEIPFGQLVKKAVQKAE